MIKRKIINIFTITFGVFLMNFAFYFFFNPSNLVTGGVSGIAIIVKDYIPFNLSYFILILNVILLILGLFLLGKDFFIKTCYASLVSPLILRLFERFMKPDFFIKDVTNSNYYFISMIVGGFLTAVGLGICFRVNATTGGMDIVQKIMTKYLHIPYSKTMYFTDWIIILLSGFFIKKNGSSYGIEGVIFGLIAVYVIGYIVDYIALNARSRRTAYIITSKPAEIKQMIFDKIGRGVTECDVRGGYTGNNMVMLICTLEKNETYQLQDCIHLIDKEAFTFMSQTKEVLGDYD